MCCVVRMAGVLSRGGYGGGMGGYGGGMGGYGMGGMGGGMYGRQGMMGQGMGQGMPGGFAEEAEMSSRPAFESIEQILMAFQSVSMMLEST